MHHRLHSALESIHDPGQQKSQSKFQKGKIRNQIKHGTTAQFGLQVFILCHRNCL